ncbi:hypothetical protein ABID20_000493 [Rhizobium alvei]|uniref:Uncharacterized protein n=2 Tax=Rhizobium alvei TaxID=1132659 RepID=A0ABT8YKC1_9HYPH|nr:hypothetical protein [Rhizobium alvei]MDO6964061.1 hypothetical protein [Rhizobium alvei]
MFSRSLSAFVIFGLMLAAPTAASAIDANGQNKGRLPAEDPRILGFSPSVADPMAPALNQKKVHFEARLTEKSQPMLYGLSWRIFKPIAGSDGKLPLLASSEGGSSDFELAPGEYFVHVAFGRAGVTKKINIPADGEARNESFVLDAGGVVLNAVSGNDMRIPPDELTFNIYSSDVQEDGERGLIMSDVKPGQVVRLNAGTYHVVSNYGDVNATIRSDIQVAAGKLLKATIQHKAAQITLKLVSQEGGEAIADTAWSILSGSGDAVSESVSAFPVVVLAEGKYVAVARHKDRIYQREFAVTSGHNQDVELLLSDESAQARSSRMAAE